MLKFGAACCFAGSGSNKPPSDAEIAAIIDRTRTGSDDLGGVLQAGKEHTVASFDATAASLNMRELQGSVYGDTSATDSAGPSRQQLESVAGLMGGGTLADIQAAWEGIASGKRVAKSRLKTEHVAGVGNVQVLHENDYCMGEEMQNKARVEAGEKAQGRQVAGRDYAHESRCLSCWKGPFAADKRAAVCSSVHAKHSGADGGLRGCDLCPAAFHLSCVGIATEDANGWGTWACAHHACTVCGRKAQHVGGLLFRCSVCPSAFCEDHLPPEVRRTTPKLAASTSHTSLRPCLSVTARLRPSVPPALRPSGPPAVLHVALGSLT